MQLCDHLARLHRLHRLASHWTFPADIVSAGLRDRIRVGSRFAEACHHRRKLPHAIGRECILQRAQTLKLPVLNRISDGLVRIVSAFKAARIAAFIYPRQIRLLISLLKLTEDSSRKGVVFLSNAQIEKTGLVEEAVSGEEERNS